MKKILLLTLMAALAFSAVSCGKTEEASAPSETESSLAETVSEDETVEDVEAALADIKEKALARTDLTAQPMDVPEIPDDWHEVSDGKLSMYVPADVEDISSDSGTFSRFQNEDGSVTVFTMGVTDWSENSGETEDELDEYFPELSEENTAKALKDMGLDYDGTRASFYKAVLSFTSEDRTEENAKAFDTAALAKGMAFTLFPEVYYNNSEGHDIYAQAYSVEALKGDLSDEGNSKFWIGAFADPNTEYTAMLTAHTKEEALQIASTIKIIG